MSGDQAAKSAATTTAKDAGVVPTDDGKDTANTLNMVECNDCTLARLIQCLQKEGTLGKDYRLPGAPFTDSPLTLNLVGLRIKNTISNKFDDRLIVFYKPVDIDPGFKVEDAKTVESAYHLNTAAIDGFLGDADVRSQLKLGSGEIELPAQESLSKDKKPCKVHVGWRLLRFMITTDPGYEKDANASGVKVNDTEPRVLAQGRAVLEPGILAASHRVGIHHADELKGYVALVQHANFNVRRASTGAHLLAEIKKLEGTWEKDWNGYKKDADTKYKKKQDAYKKAEEAYKNDEEAYKKAVAAGKKSKAPTAPTAPVLPEEAGPWVKDYVAKKLNVLLFGDASADFYTKMNTHRSFVREVREKTLVGTKHDAASVAVDYTFEEKKDPAKPDIVRTLTIKSLIAELKPAASRVLKDDDILVVSDHGGFGINIHHSYKYETNVDKVDDWSWGCQVFKGINDYKQFRRLYELSKRARCPRRGAKGDCPALSHTKITVDDLIWHYYSDVKQKEQYEKDKKTADDLLRAKLTGDALDKQFTSRIKDRVKLIEFNDAAAAAPSSKPRFPISNDEAGRAASIQKAISDKLLPAKDYDAVRKKVQDDKAVVKALREKLEPYVQADLEASSALKAKYDEKVASYKAAAIAKKKAEPAAKKEAEAKAASDAEVAALKKTEEAASVKKKIDMLGTKLTSLSGEVSDQVEWTIKDIRKQLDTKAGEFNGDGLEQCDLLYQCATTFNYVLVEAEKPDVKEIDDRFESG